MRTKHFWSWGIATVVLLLAPGRVSAQTPVGTGFTYQGQLKKAGVPVTDTVDFKFSLWDALTGGTQVGSTLTLNDLDVARGLFTIVLDFGTDIFTGDARWLEIAARGSADPAFVTLSPRQELTPTPYSIYATTAASGWGSGTAGRVPQYVDADTFSDSLLYGTSHGIGVKGGPYWGGPMIGGPDLHINPGDDDASVWIGGTKKAIGDRVGFLGFTGEDEWVSTFGPVAYGWIGAEIVDNDPTVGALLFDVAHPLIFPDPGPAMRIVWDQAAFRYRVGIGGKSNPPQAELQVFGNIALSNWIATLTDTPLELRANGVRALLLQPHGTCPNIVGGHSTNGVAADVCGATISGGGKSGGPNQVTDDYGTIGGGALNTVAEYATVGGGMQNQAKGVGDVIAGGGENVASNFWSTIAGGEANTASGWGSAIGGGGGNFSTADYTTVGGGSGNKSTAKYTTIAGGTLNEATVEYATVCGGYQNKAIGGGSATVAGGYGNTASSNCAFIGGGQYNVASGAGAVALGGFSNSAEADMTFAIGRRAKAKHYGSFVWADYSVDADFASTGSNQFLARAAGGVRFYSNSAATTGVKLDPGAGSWSSISDRNLKANFAPVDARQLLARLAAVPIETWNYTSQDPAIRHIGPMAQDFYAAFRVGEDDRHISTVDADGVALAAIQGVYEIVKEKDAQIVQQQAQIADLTARLERIEARLAKLAEAPTGGAR